MKTETAEICPVCDTGTLSEQRIDYTVTVGDGVKVVTPNLLVEICDHCGEVVLSADAADAVDATIAEQNDQLIPRELQLIRENLDVDQTEISEILGLGGKTFHRWEKGNQVPSRSMGYYLRVLEEFPEAFAWLRERGWRRQNRLATGPFDFNFRTAFPALAATHNLPSQRIAPAHNPARALFGQAA